MTKAFAFGPRADRVLFSTFDTFAVELIDTTGAAHTFDVGGDVYSVAFVPGESLFLAAGIALGGAELRRESTGTRVRRFEHVDGIVVAISGDGRFVVTGGGRTLKVWNAQNGELVHKLKPARPDHDIERLAVSHDGQTIIAIANDLGSKQLLVIDGEGRVRFELAYVQKNVAVLALAPDSRTLLHDRDDRLVIVDIAGAVVRELVPVRFGIADAAYSPDGTLIAAGGYNDLVSLWRADSGELVGKLAGHGCTPVRVAFSGDGNQLATAGEDGAVILWDVARRTAVRRLRGSETPSLALTHPVVAVAATPDGKRVAIAASDFALWSPGEPGATHVDGKGPMDSVAIDPTGRLVAIPTQPIRIVSAEDGRVLHELPVKFPPRALAFDASGVLAVAELQCWIQLFDVANGALVGELRSCGEHASFFPPELCHVAFDPRGELVAACDANGAMLFRRSGGEPTRAPDAGKAKSIAFTADGEAFVTRTDTRAQLWDRASLACLATLEHPAEVTCLATGPDGQIATGAGTTVRLWDRSGKLLAAIERPTAITALAFAGADGLIVAAGKAVERIASR